MKMRIVGLAALAALAVALPQTVFADTGVKEVVKSTFDTKVQTKTGSCVRTKWMTGSDACGSAPPPPPPPAPVVQAPPPVVVQAPPPPVPRTVVKQEDRTVYFENNKDVLTPEAKQRLDQLAVVLRNAKDVQSAEIVGFASRMGNAKHNQTLSERRAHNVENYLHERGYVNTSVANVRAVGDTEAKANCSGKMKRNARIDCTATDRKVEVQIVYATLQR